MKKLKVVVLKQKRKKGCGPAVLACLFNYFGKKVSQEEILEKIELNRRGSYNSDLGMVALGFGFKVRIFSLDLELFHKEIGRFLGTKPGAEELRKALRDLKGRKKKESESIINFINAGGDYQIRLPAGKMLTEAIDQGVPAVISVNAALFFGRSDHYRFGHYLIVSGYDQENFWVVDVFSGKELKVEANKLLVSWIFNAIDSSGYILLVGHKKRSLVAA